MTKAVRGKVVRLTYFGSGSGGKNDKWRGKIWCGRLIV